MGDRRTSDDGPWRPPEGPPAGSPPEQSGQGGQEQWAGGQQPYPPAYPQPYDQSFGQAPGQWHAQQPAPSVPAWDHQQWVGAPPAAPQGQWTPPPDQWSAAAPDQ